tara:strand:- start:817 stop:1086 length:270 start_codon:yes stop_codon:yes gene_type:complete
MLRKLYRALALAQAARAADKTIATMSDRILCDIGQTRTSFKSALVEAVRKDLDKQDTEVEAQKLAINYHNTFGTKPVKATVNENLIGAV